MTTLLDQFDDVVGRMATVLVTSNMNRAKIAADKLRQIQAEIHSCAKDQRMADANVAVEETTWEEKDSGGT